MKGLLQVSTAAQKLSEGQLFDAIISVFTSVVPMPIFATLVFGPIGMGYYIVQRSVVIPAVMIVLIAGVSLAQMPPTIANFALVAVAVSLTAIGFILIDRLRV